MTQITKDSIQGIQVDNPTKRAKSWLCVKYWRKKKHQLQDDRYQLKKILKKSSQQGNQEGEPVNEKKKIQEREKPKYQQIKKKWRLKKGKQEYN